MKVKALIVGVVLLIPLLSPSPSYAQTCPTLRSDAGTVTTSITLPTSGQYVIWSRMRASANAQTTNNSYWLQIDNSCAVNVGDSSEVNSDSWSWVDYRDGTTSTKYLTTLSSGSHVVKIVTRESGVRLDKILFLTDTACQPTGLGDNCLAAATVTPTSIQSTPTAPPLPTASPTKTPTPQPTNTPFPTSTPIPSVSPNTTRFSLNLLLHGLGNGGDNANPGAIGNTTPLHPQKQVTLELFDSTNTLVKSIPGTISYNASLGNFSGTLDGGLGISGGSYLVKVKSPSYLRKQLGGIITIISGQTVSLPQTALVAGDANNDNSLNILDYNLMLDCYSELAPARNCNPTKLLQTDFNDDGSVNQFDYNLFLRELSVLSGQ